MENYAEDVYISTAFGDCGALEIKHIPDYTTEYDGSSEQRDGFQRNLNKELSDYKDSKIVFASVYERIWKEMFKPYGWKIACTRRGNYGGYRMYYIYKILNEEFK